MLVWRPLYSWIARNRYRLSGGEACDDGSVCAAPLNSLSHVLSRDGQLQ